MIEDIPAQEIPDDAAIIRSITAVDDGVDEEVYVGMDYEVDAEEGACLMPQWQKKAAKRAARAWLWQANLDKKTTAPTVRTAAPNIIGY